MQLIYRGQTFNYMPAPARTYRSPRSVNWRYQVEGENYSEISMPSTPRACPRAINWRYRMIVTS